MTTSQRPVAPKATGWVGWIVFTAAIMLMLGAFNIISGLAAVFTDDIFVTGAAGTVVLDVTAWGWVHLVAGAILVLVGIFLFQGATWARVTATVFVMLNMLSQLLFLPAYPFWSTIIIVLGVLALWALVVHGDEKVTG